MNEEEEIFHRIFVGYLLFFMLDGRFYEEFLKVDGPSHRNGIRIILTAIRSTNLLESMQMKGSVGRALRIEINSIR